MKKISFIFLVLTSLFLLKCKKYSDGGFTYKAKKKIIGIWEVESLFVDGADSTANIKASPDYCDNTIGFVDINDHDDYSLLINSQCGLVGIESHWGVTDDKKSIWMKYEKETYGVIELYPLILNEYAVLYWDIERLTRKKMWLKINYNSKEYFLKLYKK